MKITILGTVKFEEGTAKFEEECVQIGIKFVFDKETHRREHLYMLNTNNVGLAKLRFLAYSLPVLFRISSPANIPLMEACINPRVIPAPSPIKKRFWMSVSKAGEIFTRLV